MADDLIPLREHLAALREADLRFDSERDRRLMEVNAEREKALKIKETADLAALELAREIQTYKDEKANELRSQIERERGGYATKDDLHNSIREVQATIKPVIEFVSQYQGGMARQGEARLNIGAILGAASVLLVLVFGVLTVMSR